MFKAAKNNDSKSIYWRRSYSDCRKVEMEKTKDETCLVQLMSATDGLYAYGINLEPMMCGQDESGYRFMSKMDEVKECEERSKAKNLYLSAIKGRALSHTRGI
ncbi:hypothetical protein Tco_0599169 [Tanacetum coccineum]